MRTRAGSRALVLTWVFLQLSFGAHAQDTLRIVSDATFPPFHYLEADSATGFDIELARLMAERAGFKPVVAVRPYDELLPGLTTGVHDLVAATTGVTPERERVYLFTNTYFETCQAALVRVGSGEPQAVIELKGRRVGAGGAGTAARAMRSLTDSRQVTLGKGQAGVPALEDRTIDALVLDEFDAVRAARQSNGRLRVLREPVVLEHYAFVLPRGRAEWKHRLDQALAELEKEGRVAELEKRFGVARDATWPVDMDR
jgi:polar amino acid transport system substrate-binding protein